MATTTNYGWTTPDDTALVKDGAAAIRTLGSSVDTTTKALNPETTLGDLAYRSSTANVKTRLGLGTAGQVLQVNSGANAPEWATLTSGGMTLISTTTLSGASTTLSSIPATYNDLYVIVKNYLPATDNASLRFRFNADSNANRHKAITYETAGALNTFTADLINLSVSSDNAVSTSLHSVYFPDYKNTTTWKMANCFSIATDATTTTSFNYRALFAFYNQTAAISSLEFFNSTGNFTSGTVLLYGVK